MENQPKVWGPGDLTVAIGMQGYRVWVGELALEFVEEVKVKMNSQGSPKVEIKFPKSHDKDLQLKIEENVRLAKTIPWLQVAT